MLKFLPLFLLPPIVSGTIEWFIADTNKMHAALSCFLIGLALSTIAAILIALSQGKFKPKSR